MSNDIVTCAKLIQISDFFHKSYPLAGKLQCAIIDRIISYHLIKFAIVISEGRAVDQQKGIAEHCSQMAVGMTIVLPEIAIFYHLSVVLLIIAKP